MADEIERKFLIQDEIPADLGTPSFIKQGYIILGDNRHLRIRLEKNDATLGLKFTGEKIRKEYEYKVPYFHGKEMYERCDFYLEKLRFTFYWGDDKYEFDSFPNGMKYVEIEFKTLHEAESFIPPKWLGEDITHDSKYSNITLAEHKLRFT